MGATLLKLSGLSEHPAAYTGVIATSCDTGIGVLDSPACSETPVCCESGVRPSTVSISLVLTFLVIFGQSGLVGIGCVPVNA